MEDKKKTKSTTKRSAADKDAEARLTDATRMTSQSSRGGNLQRRDLSDCEEEGNGNGPVTVRLARTAVTTTSDVALWAAIRKSTEAISFNNYDDFVSQVFAHFNNSRTALPPSAKNKLTDIASRRFLPFSNVDPYLLLRIATEVFLALNGAVDTGPEDAEFTPDDARAASVALDDDITVGELECLWDEYRVPVGQRSLLPYMDIIRRRVDGCSLQRIAPAPNEKTSVERGDDGESEAAMMTGFDRILSEKLYRPYMFELIWSYWQEEGMLTQTVNAIARRFQNIRVPGIGRDPLSNLEISSLFPLSNLLWGYIQDEQHRLSIIRRAYEYDHHYGISIQGKAVPQLSTADSRSKFIEAFHHLLYLCSIFFKQDDDTTVRADGFPLLNALREVHILLSQGAHNQFGDMPSTARQEMLEQQWILSRPEFSQFLPTRVSVGYPEAWMDRVDAMKSLQGWNDTSVMHFNNLAVYGERILLTIRYGAWSLVNQQPANAANWARSWRSEIQGYLHSYRAVTGVDLSSASSSRGVDSTPPSVLLANRYRSSGVRL